MMDMQPIYKVPLLERLAQIAEECAELAQAALKLRRVYSDVNPTPTEEDMAYEAFLEEIADVQLCLKSVAFDQNSVNRIMQEKYDRWIQRLGAKERRGKHERKTGA